MRKVFGREPAVIVALIEGLILAASTFLTSWTAETVGVVQLVATLLLAVYIKWGTVEEVTSVILQLGKAVLVLLVTFGVNLSADRQAVLLGLLAAAVAAFTRTQVSAIVPPPATPTVPGAVPVDVKR